MLIRDPIGSFEFVDFRETAPAAASTELFKEVHLPERKGLKRYAYYLQVGYVNIADRPVVCLVR